jgi:hypothetical protein
MSDQKSFIREQERLDAREVARGGYCRCYGVEPKCAWCRQREMDDAERDAARGPVAEVDALREQVQAERGRWELSEHLLEMQTRTAAEYRERAERAKAELKTSLATVDSLRRNLDVANGRIGILSVRAERAEAAAANWEARADEQGVRAEVAEAEVADYHDLHLPAAAEGIVSVARRWRDLALEAEQRNAELLQRAELAERRLAALNQDAQQQGGGQQ